MTYAQAKHLFQSQKHIRVLFEEGAAKGEPSGRSAAALRALVRSWPVAARASATPLLPAHRRQADAQPSRSSASARRGRSRPTRRRCRATDYSGSSSDIWRAHPTYHWRQIPKGTGLGWITRPMKKNVGRHRGRLARRLGEDPGQGRRPRGDGQRRPAQRHGRSTCRAGGCAPAIAGSTRSRRRRSDRCTPTCARDARDDAEGQVPEAADRDPRRSPSRSGSATGSGSRIDAPGGAKPLWAFRHASTTGSGSRSATDRRHPSSLVLSVVPGIAVPEDRAAVLRSRCGSQPCRTVPRLDAAWPRSPGSTPRDAEVSKVKKSPWPRWVRCFPSDRSLPFALNIWGGVANG